MGALKALRRELGIRREAAKDRRPVLEVRQQRDAKDTLVRRDAAALGASEADVRRAHSAWLDGTIAIATKFGRVHLRPKDTDLLVLRQVFVDGEYKFGEKGQMDGLKASCERMLAKGQTPIIIDAGANMGAASRWFSLLFPKAAVIGVEPDPGNAAVARLNAEETPGVRVIEAAIGSAPGVVKLQTFDNQGWGARTERAETGIKVVTINDLVAGVPNGSLLIVKIDIEGFEGDLFSANTEWIDQAEAIIIEPHDWMMPGGGTSQSFQQALLGKGRELLIAGENLVFV